MSEKSSESRGIENEKSSANHVDLNSARFTSSSGFEAEGEYYAIYPNRWAYYRKHYLREAASEFLGCMVLVIFGTGVDLQVILSNNTRVASSPKGDMLSIHFGWAVGTALGVWTASVSGGHINPAVTLAFTVFRGFPWRKVPIYLLAQLSGACFGGLLTYSNYMHAIAIVDPGKTQATASLFTTYALDYMPNVACFFSEFLGTAVLLIIVLATADNANGPPPKGLGPLVLFIVILGEGVSLGMETAYALNPARDLGPRIALAMVGYSKQVLFDYRHQYWIWTPILGPVSGALIGTFVYDALMFTGPESVLNFPNAAAQKYRAKALEQQRHGAGGIDIV